MPSPNRKSNTLSNSNNNKNSDNLGQAKRKIFNNSNKNKKILPPVKRPTSKPVYKNPIK